MADEVDIGLSREPLDVKAAVARVTCADAGGICVFLGTTRAERALSEGGAVEGSGQMGELQALDYQAYEEMAVSEIQKLVNQAQNRWPVKRIAIWHRTGEVKIGEASVVIAVSCPHRQEAFDACEFLIDELKKSVPIWKKEIYRRGSRWQGEDAGTGVTEHANSKHAK